MKMRSVVRLSALMLALALTLGAGAAGAAALSAAGAAFGSSCLGSGFFSAGLAWTAKTCSRESIWCCWVT